MRARIAEGRQPSWDLDLRYGKDGERAVAKFIEGFENGYVEVKRDRRFVDTNRIYIEYECLRGGVWQPSGIATSTADYWALILAETIVLGVPTAALRRCYLKALDPVLKMTVSETDGSHPTHGVAIGLGVFLTWLRIELSREQAA